jgi:circadian clock protein KaiB
VEDGMRPKRPRSSTKEFEEALNGCGRECYQLRLYVAGTKSRLTWVTIANLKKLCEEHLKGRYHLEVIDIYQQPTLAQSEQIIATPTLLKKLPPPLRKLIGDMSNTGKVLLGLNIRERTAP